MKPNYFILPAFVLFLLSCDSDTDVLYPDPFHPDQALFRSSLFVEVVNKSGQPVANTIIRIGNYKRLTDNRGFVYLKDVLVGASTYLVAENDSYFHASRRLYPMTGHSQYVKIILLSFSRDAIFSSTDGATVTVAGNVKLHFPEDAYEYLDGQAYEGNVVVAAEVIPADDPDLSYKMPGDLTGVNASGEAGSLASMGMVAVEMQSSEGNKLKLRTGAQVQIDMTVPSTLLDNAPSTIPMWYFDEDSGLWKEEGSATLSGNIYSASVSHFSYWNYDAWFPAVKWGATFDFGNRGTAAQLEVCITILSMNTTKCAYTDDLGMVCGLVAANELLLMEVHNECGNLIYSEQIGPFSDSTMIGPITLSDPSIDVVSIRGHAINCDGMPVTAGYAEITIGLISQYAPLDNKTGAFSASLATCEENDVHILVIDVHNNKLSTLLVWEYAPVIDADTITVCSTNDELIDIEILGLAEHYYFYKPGMSRDGDFTLIDANSGFSQGSQIYFGFRGQNTGIHEIYLGSIAIYLEGTGWFFGADSLNQSLNITRYGEVGDYISGSFSGTCILEGSPGSPGVEYPYNGSFTVLREE